MTWAGVLPDPDGLTVLPDLGNKVLGRPESDFYFRYNWTHGLAAAIVTAIAAFLLGQRRLRAALLCFIAFHVHLICDVVGRGPTAADIWPIGYLEPLSSRWTTSWNGQWALNDRRNVLLSDMLIPLALALAVRRGYSPVSLSSRKADAAVVAPLSARFGRDR